MTQAKQRIGYFGPAGTFTEQALLTQSDLANCELVPFRTVPDVLDAVTSGEAVSGELGKVFNAHRRIRGPCRGAGLWTKP